MSRVHAFASRWPRKGLYRKLAVAFSALLVVSLAGCGSPSSPASPSTNTTLTVYAAASLQSSFTSLGKTFESQHPGVTVKFDFDGSQNLVSNISNGAQADVLATADDASMNSASSKQLVGATHSFATNTLTMITPPDNPAHITGMDSSLNGTKLVICAPDVPCGAAAQKLASVLGITLNPVSKEEKVTDVVSKVTTGEADAGIVYKTDAKTAGAKVKTVDIKDADQVVNNYPIAQVSQTKNAEMANQFVQFVLSDAGQKALAGYGFGAANK